MTSLKNVDELVQGLVVVSQTIQEDNQSGCMNPLLHRACSKSRQPGQLLLGRVRFASLVQLRQADDIDGPIIMQILDVSLNRLPLGVAGSVVSLRWCCTRKDHMRRAPLPKRWRPKRAPRLALSRYRSAIIRIPIVVQSSISSAMCTHAAPPLSKLKLRWTLAQHVYGGREVTPHAWQNNSAV